LGFTGGLIGAAWLGKTLLQLFSDPHEPPVDPSSPAPTPPPQPIDPKPEPSISPSLTAEDFTLYDFEVVTVNEIGEIINRGPKQAYAFRETIGESFIDLVAIVGGTFTMGSPADEEGRDTSEGPQRDVTVPQFLMGKYPVTQAQWKAVAALPKIERDLEADPAHYKGDNRPVERVTWDDAVEFCQRLSNHTGREYRLPSEAEWEYACRAGTTTPFHFGPTITTNLANYRGTYWEYKGEGKTYLGSYGQGPKGAFRGKTTDVGSFPPNAFGLYDMHGNVWEWCLDHWHDTYDGAPTDGRAWLSSGENNPRRTRGGSLYYAPSYCRSAYRGKSKRDFYDKDFGFRIVCASSWAV
jgi:formylglycine-generating enzyme required for sulfatase activity